MFGSRDGIAVADIHRGVVLEALGEAAAGGAAQAFRGDFLHSHRLDGRDERGPLTSLYLYLVQHVGGMENVVVMRWLCHVMHCVVLVADATEHKTTDGFMQWDFIVSVGIGRGAFVDDFPIDIDARDRRALAVFVLFIDRAFDESLRKGC